MTRPGDLNQGRLEISTYVVRWHVLTGLFAHSVAQVSASSKELVIAVFSSTVGRRKFCRRAIVQGRVRSMVVVVLMPGL